MVEMLGRYSNPPPLLLLDLCDGEVSRSVDRAAGPPKPRQQPLRPEEIQHLLTAYAAGASTYELAAELSLGRQTVANYIRRHGGQLRTRWRAELDPANRNKARELAAEGLSARVISRRLQAGYRAVQRVLESVPTG
jgi:DNA invertase Pin-like site-specific DNA recombinase